MATKQEIWSKKSINTAKPEYKANTWTAGIVDKPPTTHKKISIHV